MLQENARRSKFVATIRNARKQFGKHISIQETHVAKTRSDRPNDSPTL